METEFRLDPNLSSRAASDFYAIVGIEVTPEQLVRIWNKYLKQEAVRCAEAGTKASHARITANFRRLRREFRDQNIEIIEDVAEFTDEGGLRLKESARNKVAPPAEPPKSKPVKVEQKAKPVFADTLSETERAILMATATTTPEAARVIDAVPTLTDEDKAEMLRAAEASEAADRKHRAFIEWACQKADVEADSLRDKKQGEALWNNAVTVEAYPGDPALKIVMVRSSTAPMLGKGGPVVKHDYKANERAVTVYHDMMVRTLNHDQKLVRSRILTPKVQEYYCKALQYREGMFLKGYFEVNGVEQHQLARYFVVKGGAVCPVTEDEYRRLANRAAAHPEG